MSHPLVEKAFAVSRGGVATRLTPRPAPRKRKAIRVDSSGQALAIRTKVDAPGPQRLPFLHPKARGHDAATTSTRYNANRRVQNAESSAAEAVRVARSPGGPRAPQKVKDALSGADYQDTLSRLGRATRRQDKEFSAQVHPLSGRVLDMRRGGSVATQQAIGAVRYRTKSSEKLASLADRTKNPKVRERAVATLSRQNPRTKGPDPVQVHNHPTIGHGPQMRHYPSATDLAGAASTGSRSVVLSHKPGPRGSKKTKAVTVRAVGRNAGTTAQGNFARHDTATINDTIVSRAGKTRFERDVLRELRSEAREGRKKLVPYDKYVAAHTRSRKAARKSGFYSTEALYKALKPRHLDVLGRAKGQLDAQGHYARNRLALHNYSQYPWARDASTLKSGSKTAYKAGITRSTREKKIVRRLP